MVPIKNKVFLVKSKYGWCRERDLQRAIEMSEQEAIQRRINARNQGIAEESSKKSDDIIDFFGSLEAPQPQQQQQQYDPFAGFGGVDPFAFNQQQVQQQQLQQQQFQQQQMLQQQMMQQQMLQQQMLQQQQMQQQQTFDQGFGGNPFAAAGNPFAQQQQQAFSQPQQQFAKPAPPPLQFNTPAVNPDLNSNLKTIDPFASLAQNRGAAGPNIGMDKASAVGSNPFGVSTSPKKDLVNLDANSLQKQASPPPKNPFSTSPSKYQWEPSNKPAPTLAQLQNNQPQQFGMQTGFNTAPMGMNQTGYGQPMQPTFTGASQNSFGGQPMQNQATGNPFAQPFGNAQGSSLQQQNRPFFWINW